MCKIDLKEAYFAVPLKHPEICEIPVYEIYVPALVFLQLQEYLQN